MANIINYNPGELPISYKSGGSYVASGVVKSSGPARLNGFSGYNSGAAQFIMVFDSATVPADGSIPEVIISVAATSSFAYDPGQRGMLFSNGIAWSNSSTAPTKTIGAVNCFLRASYD